MNQESYERQKEYAKSKGITVDPRLERKQVNGIWGMFAKEKIPCQSVLASFPKQIFIPVNGDFTFNPSDNDFSYFRHASVELSKGDKSAFSDVFTSFDSLEDLKNISCYFCSDKELETLARMSAPLHEKVLEFNARTKQRVDEIISAEPDVHEDVALEVILNSGTRGWGNLGFLPMIDQFNHLETIGDTLRDLDHGKRLGYITKVDLEPGDQAVISYNRHDLYQYAISYNFFDPNGSHYIDVAYRLVHSAKSDIEKKMLSMMARKYQIATKAESNAIRYKILGTNLMLQESGPSANLIDFIRETAIKSEHELKALRCDKKSFDRQFLNLVDFMLSTNKVDQIDMARLPVRIERFHMLLTKEKEILIKNKRWILENSSDHILCPDLKSVIG